MHLDGRPRLRFGTASNRLSRCLAVLFPATIVGSLYGQGVLPPPAGFQGAPAVPSTGNVTPATGQSSSQVSPQTVNQINNEANGNSEFNGQGTSATADANAPKEAAGANPLMTPLDAMTRWGAMHVHLHASYQFIYATGIHNEPGVSIDTFTHTLAPGVRLDLGPHVMLDYTPSIRFYSEKDFHNTVDQSLSFHAGYGYGDWTLGLSQNATYADEPLVQTSSQVQHSDYTTGLLASYAVNEKTTLETTLGVDIENTSGGGTNIFVGGSGGAASALTDSQTYNGAERLEYKFNEHLSGGVVASIGYTEQAGGFKSIQEEYDAHVGWHPGPKLSATISGGFEQRNFLNSKASASWSPVYSVELGYQLFEQTALSAFANRSVNASIFDNQLSEDTGLGVGLQQRLLGKMHLSLGFGYAKTDYQSTATTNLNTSRKDESLSYTAGLTVPFLQRCNFATFYQYSQNHSSQKGFSYDSSTVGVTLAWSY